MAIFRGTGGSGDSTQDATLNEVTQQALNASNSAIAAATSATNAGSSASAAATSATNASTSETNAASSATAAASSESNALSSASTASTKAGESSTSASSASTSASTATTKASEASSSASAAAADLVATNQDTIDTAADLVATNADVVLTAADVVSAEADKVQTGLDRAAVAADLVATNQDTIDTAADVTSSGTNATNAANSAAAAATALDNFDDRYLGAKSSAPSVDNDGAALVEGAMYFDSSSNGMKVYDGADWIAASAAGTASMLTYRYIATNAQTTFSGSDANSATLSYTVSNIIVLLNGIALDSSDFTATSGTSVVLGTGATTGDEFVVVAFKSFTVADHYTKTAADARFEPIDSAYTKAEADANLAALVDSSPAALDTLNELAAALGDDANFSTTVNNSIALKAPVASPNFTGGIDVTGTVTADGLAVRDDSTTGKYTFQSSDQRLTLGTYWESGVGQNAYINSSSNTETVAQSLLLKTGNVTRQTLAPNGDISFYEDTGTTPKFFWDASAESLGIGTSSPTSKLEVNGGADNSTVFSGRSDGGNGNNTRFNIKAYSDGGGAGYGGGIKIQTRSATNVFSDAVAIDSSGNVLVGTTLSDVGWWYNRKGVVAKESGQLHAAAYSIPAAVFNRNTDDGDIVEFRKAGSKVGSIQSRAGLVTTIILDPRASGVGLTGTGNAVRPTDNVGATNDGVMDLGSVSGKFKDAFLSGGIHLGGAGAANKLDDYETGSFTATLVGPNATTTGYYTKVGDVVAFSLEFVAASTSGNTGHVTIAGLPFNTIGNPRPTYVVHTYAIGLNGGTYPIAMSESSGTNITLYGGKDNAGWSTIYYNGNTIYLAVSGTYRTT